MSAKKITHHLVGIDYGAKRIGLALTDELNMFASPWTMVPAEHSMVKTVKKLVKEIEELEKSRPCIVDKLIVGMPYRLGGAMGVMADEVTHFIDFLKKETKIPVISWDERLTSSIAEKSLMEAGFSRKNRVGRVDSVAASLVLQSYIDYERSISQL